MYHAPLKVGCLSEEPVFPLQVQATGHLSGALECDSEVPCLHTHGHPGTGAVRGEKTL